MIYVTHGVCVYILLYYIYIYRYLHTWDFSEMGILTNGWFFYWNRPKKMDNGIFRKPLYSADQAGHVYHAGYTKGWECRGNVYNGYYQQVWEKMESSPSKMRECNKIGKPVN